MTLDERLTDAFDLGLSEGVQSLSPEDQQLYRIQDFILEFEMGGLSGYMYNRLPDVAGIGETVAALRQFEFLRLSELLEQTANLFREYRDPNPPTTWEQVRKEYDPENRLDSIADEISALAKRGYGVSSVA